MIFNKLLIHTAAKAAAIVNQINIMITTIQLDDFNNNTYRVTSNKLTYKAIQPHESSSGTYSGGDDFEQEISTEQFQHICTKVQAIMDNKAIQTNQRRMMTARLFVKTDIDNQRFIIVNSEGLRELLAVLKKYR
ncbi:MAG: hypothetical protein AB8G11_17185 [Saprospiraceae bacterium]